MPPPAEPSPLPEPALAMPPPEHQLDFDPGAVSRALGEPGSSPFSTDDLEPPGEIGGHFLDDEPDGSAGFDLGDATLDDADAPGASSEPDVPLAFDDLAPPIATRQPAIALPPPPAPVTSGLVAQAAPQAARGLDVPAELQRALAEIEQYVSMGFVEDARGVLEEVASRFAGHPALVQRLADLGLEMPGLEPAAQMEDLVLADPPSGSHTTGAADEPADEPAAEPADEPLQFGADFLEFTPTGDPPSAASPGPAAPPAEPEAQSGPGDGGFDLASELGDLFGAQPAVASESSAAAGTDFGDASLADIFREFQKGVDKQLGKEDYETRYNLGIAYKEMGLVDEAIAEFQLAAKDESRLLECASMLGICFLEKGMPKLAVKWFEKGLVAPGRSEEEYQGLKYDLASALEQAGEPDRALALFTELYGQDTQFRDVADKMRLLGAGR